MPELPEVETTRRGIAPHLEEQMVVAVVVRQPRLRWPVPATLAQELPGQRINGVSRRGKYLLLETAPGTLIIHLGMSGSLRIVADNSTAARHDHVDLVLGNGKVLRFTDPRRFGCLLWHREAIASHPLIAPLGPEPLGRDFNGAWLFERSRKRSVPVKPFIMDSRIVTGVGNIYANESLFLAGIDPRRAAGRIARRRYTVLAECIGQVLRNAIEAGGTTLRDFSDGDGKPGYFAQSLRVYGRGGLQCQSCDGRLREIRLGQRSTVYCTNCQR